MTEVIVRNKNRMLYSASQKCYVTYEQLKEFIKQGKEIRVLDGKCKQGTNKDITNYILRQIIRYDEQLDNSKLMELIKQ